MKRLLSEVTIKDLRNGSEYLANVRAQDIDHPMGDLKCVINLFDGQAKIAFASFLMSDDRSHFEGMKVDRNYRGRSLGNACMEIYLKLSDQYDLEVGKTTPQKKPDLCFLLTQYGMTPCSGQKRYEVMVLPREDDIFRIHFLDSAAKDRFLRTNIYNVGSYSIVDHLPDGCDGISLFVGPNYSISDMGRHDARRDKNDEKFEICLTNLESLLRVW